MERRKTILVVDDEMLLRVIAADLFTEYGFEVLLAEDGNQGMNLLQQRPEISALITDLEMPGEGNGYLLAKWARDTRPDLPIILVSGKSEPKSATLPIGYRFIRKPYDPEQIVYAVNQLLSTNQSAKEGSVD
jgi:DNA-binding NtrC family response regulator